MTALRYGMARTGDTKAHQPGRRGSARINSDSADDGDIDRGMMLLTHRSYNRLQQ
jgi:hypothetical protein